VSRPNRFLVEALLEGQIVQAHLADRGRLKETLVPGARLILAQNNGAGRKTAFQAVAAYRGETLASLDTQLPNRLIEAALRAGALPQFAQYPIIRREVKIGESRFDFQLANDKSRCIVEVKSAGLIIDGIALFPDAPTERGRRHLSELVECVQSGERAAVVFVVQGGDAHAMTVNREIDPQFADALLAAQANGVEVYAYACTLNCEGLILGPRAPVIDNVVV
jgi:sugar fermentation stimulation protein A